LFGRTLEHVGGQAKIVADNDRNPFKIKALDFGAGPPFIVLVRLLENGGDKIAASLGGALLFRQLTGRNVLLRAIR